MFTTIIRESQGALSLFTRMKLNSSRLSSLEIASRALPITLYATSLLLMSFKESALSESEIGEIQTVSRC